MTIQLQSIDETKKIVNDLLTFYGQYRKQMTHTERMAFIHVTNFLEGIVADVKPKQQQRNTFDRESLDIF